MLKPERYFVIYIVDKANDSLLFMRISSADLSFSNLSAMMVSPLNESYPCQLERIAAALNLEQGIEGCLFYSKKNMSFNSISILWSIRAISSNCYYKFLPDESWISRERRKWWLFKSWNERWIRTSLQERFLHKERKCWQKSLSINLRENFLTMCLELFY